MPKTNRDIITKGLRLIGVCPINDAPQADEYATALEHLEAILSEADEIDQIGHDFTSDALPDWAFIPLAMMVGGRVCSEFEVPQFGPLYGRGKTLLRAKAANESRTPGRPVEATYF